jgi:hypothetical protein
MIVNSREIGNIGTGSNFGDKLVTRHYVPVCYSSAANGGKE